jgi:flavin-binding protein dodecin
MPKVFTAKAAKDYPDHGIVKGQTYFYWSNFRGPKQMSATRPRRSQITGSSKLAAVYAVEEALEDAVNEATTPEELVAALDDAISGAEDCVSEYEESISNLEEGFPNGCPALDETNEAKDSIEAWKDALESAKDAIEALDATDYVEEPEEPKEGEPKPEPRAKVEDFDDLNESEQEAMLNDAQEEVNGASLDL